MTNTPKTTIKRALYFILFVSLISFSPDSLFAQEKVSSINGYEGYTEAENKGFKYKNIYLTMDDGTKLAVDYFIPKKLKKGEKVPTIIYQTRYIRSIKLKWFVTWLKDPFLAQISEKEIKYFTSHGYACVIVDARGSGASSGRREMEFSPEEVADGAEVVDWIIEQDWSDGQVATTGVSYVGTTAELLLVNQHPAVKACIPRSNIFDLYDHVMFPGGVRQGPFVDIWGYTTRALDQHDFDAFGKRAGRVAKAVHPVKGGKSIYKQAIETHKTNFDVYDGLLRVNYRDDTIPELDYSADGFSIHSNIDKIANSGTAIYRIGGWYDGALAKSVIQGFMNTHNTEKVLLGPWDHGPANKVGLAGVSSEVGIHIYEEMRRFLDHELKGIDNGIDKEPTFYYYTVGAEEWKTTEVWPPKNTEPSTFYLSKDNRIVAEENKREPGEVRYKVDHTSTTGTSSRWNSVTGLYKDGDTRYYDRKEESAKLLNFNMAPLKEDMTMTGAPVISLYMAADALDAAVFCYIEDVAPDGSVTYVTEGLFRAMHRKPLKGETYKATGPQHSYLMKDSKLLKPGSVELLSFDFIPISYQFKKGHSIRLSIAGADKGHFDPVDYLPNMFTIGCSDVYPSSISIPFERESAVSE